jgi:hypothetical protein
MQIQFTSLGNNFQGLVRRGLLEWSRYLDGSPSRYRWHVFEKPIHVAAGLEVLKLDLQEDELLSMVSRMPYLLTLSRTVDLHGQPVQMESLMAFLTVFGRNGLATILRQISDPDAVSSFLHLDRTLWEPVVFLVSGQPDLDVPLIGTNSPVKVDFDAPAEASS